VRGWKLNFSKSIEKPLRQNPKQLKVDFTRNAFQND
jgi:hypothetical protein